MVGYQNQPLIQNIEIELKRGNPDAVGPNGAGKSTILKSIARQLELLGGSVFGGGKFQSFPDVSCKRWRLSSQSAAHGAMTCEDVVATGRYPIPGSLKFIGKGS
ncbi:MAG: ATP-binding cassette domain-containing protein [Gallintestinimicrobium sp.]